jgi:hypothetical protein
MKSLRNTIAMSAVITALAAGAVAAHAQSAGAEFRQDENSPQQLSMGPVQGSPSPEREGSAAAFEPEQAESTPPTGIPHRADSRPVGSFLSKVHASLTRKSVISSPFDDPINTASPGG